MGDTKIQWTDKSWSPLRARVRRDAGRIAEEKGYKSLITIGKTMAGHVGPHCERVSHGCDNCYSQTNNHRCLPANGTGLPFDRRSRELIEPFVDEHLLLDPFRWKSPKKIFVENQSDLFGEWVPEDHIDRVLAVMESCRQHTFQLLTKRPERMREYFSATVEFHGQTWPAAQWRLILAANLRNRTTRQIGSEAWPLRNVWLGISCEDWETAEGRTAILRQVPARVRFISQEPQIDGRIEWMPDTLSGIHWLVQGGESGPGARQLCSTSRTASRRNSRRPRSLRDRGVEEAAARRHGRPGGLRPRAPG